MCGQIGKRERVELELGMDIISGKREKGLRNVTEIELTGLENWLPAVNLSNL